MPPGLNLPQPLVVLDGECVTFGEAISHPCLEARLPPERRCKSFEQLTCLSHPPFLFHPHLTCLSSHLDIAEMTQEASEFSVALIIFNCFLRRPWQRRRGGVGRREWAFYLLK